MSGSNRFWEVKSIKEMTEAEWESLCDCCGQCCLHKIEDPDTGKIDFTRVACQYLDLDTCRCLCYQDRLERVDTCVKIGRVNFSRLHLLPKTCAYRRLSEGKSLPPWHPLISEDLDTVHYAEVSVRGKVVPEQNVHHDDFEEFIINATDEY